MEIIVEKYLIYASDYLGESWEIIVNRWACQECSLIPKAVKRPFCGTEKAEIIVEKDLVYASDFLGETLNIIVNRWGGPEFGL